MIDLDRRRLPFVAVALLGWLLVIVAAFLPWFVMPDGTGPSAFGLPADILVGALDEAFAGAGPMSIGLILAGLALIGLVTLPTRRARLVGGAGGLLALLCSADYALQMLRSFESLAYQTFGPSLLLAALGGLMATAGASLVELRRGK